jgi:4-hydroxy-2-oxoheptanedioate aldolase
MTELTNSALERLKADELSLGIGIRITSSPAIARTMKTGGFDWLFIDLEHGNLGMESCAHVSVAGLDAGIAPLVRVPPGQFWMASRALEGGALGIVMPNVMSAAEARQVVDVVKFPPLGQRNVGGPPVHTGHTPRSHADYAAMFNASSLAVVMVETPEAIAEVDAIAAVEGVDVVMIGCNDLSTSMGVSGQTDHPKVVDAFEKLTAACKKHGKWAGVGGVPNDVHAQRYIGMGVRFVLAGAETGFLAAGAKARSGDLRKLDGSGT